MRIVHFEKGGVPGIAADDGSGWHGLTERESGFPGTLPELITQGADLLHAGRDLLPMQAIDLNAVRILPPVPKPPKILCVGLNYDDHLEESGLKKPVYPEIFARFATSLIAHRESIRRPRESSMPDYEAELAVVIGRGGRRIQHDRALDHVAGFSRPTLLPSLHWLNALTPARITMNQSVSVDAAYNQNLKMTMLIVLCTALCTIRKTTNTHAATTWVVSTCRVT